jgi:protein phosphatase
MTQQATPSIDVFGLTDTGKARENNEDQFLVAELRHAMRPLYTGLEEGTPGIGPAERQALLLVVADGVGGGVAGELASAKTVQGLAEHVAAAGGCFYAAQPETEHEFIERLEAAMAAAHEKVKEELAEHGGQPASTATMVSLYWPRGYIFHVGDSRGYYLRKGVLKQFTRDQTMSEEMVDSGMLTEEQAKQSRFSNVLSRAIGAHDATPAIGLVDFQEGDIVLLCSDGLTKHVEDEALQRALEEETSAEAACRRLLNAALDGGGKDNITLIVARMGAV